MNAQCFGCLLKSLQILRCPPESEPGEISPGFNGIMAVQCFFPMTVFRTGGEGQGRNGSTFRRQGDDLCIHCQIQPDLPALPGGKMFRQWCMMGTGRQKHRAVQPIGVYFRYSHRAGEGRYQPGGKGYGLLCFRLLEIQHHPGTVHGPDCLTDLCPICIHRYPFICQDQQGAGGKGRRGHPFRGNRTDHPGTLPGNAVFFVKFCPLHGKISSGCHGQIILSVV